MTGRTIRAAGSTYSAVGYASPLSCLTHVSTTMSRILVNYDDLAPTYNQRYTINQHAGIVAALQAVVQTTNAKLVLEVGCGTGRWLPELQSIAERVYGLDLSVGMLRQAHQRRADLDLICGHASRLPFPDAMFNLIFCVNAFHHFAQPHAFLAEARRLLGPGGKLAIIGMDPHDGQDRWYIYDYFEGTYEADVARFPARETLSAWMLTAGFADVEHFLVERMLHQVVDRGVLADPTLQKYGTSQLALLTDDAYTTGRRRIEAALVEAEARNERVSFPVDISLFMVIGTVPTHRSSTASIRV